MNLSDTNQIYFCNNSCLNFNSADVDNVIEMIFCVLNDVCSSTAVCTSKRLKKNLDSKSTSENKN